MTEDGSTSVARGLVDLVHLIPFDVQIAVTENKGIQQHEVSNIVTTWLNDSFREKLWELGFTEANSYAAFDSVVLFNNDDNRRLQQGELYTAKFRGGAVFSRDEVSRIFSVPKEDVILIQQAALLNDVSLANRLRASRIESLGAVVADVNAFMNPLIDSSGSSTRLNLEVIIIGAIVVACVAFVFLLSAVFWAYRYDRNKQEAYKNYPDRTDTSTAQDESPEKALSQYPPVEIADSNYPESVISDSVVSGSVLSEDISASLSQYYKSGMGRVSSSAYRGSAMLSDAGSVSSMESYGYSVDAATANPLPTEVSLKGDDDNHERIGGLPIGPVGTPGVDSDIEDDLDDVQIPDLDKELKILDIQLTPSTDGPSDADSSSSHGQPYVAGEYCSTPSLGGSKDREDSSPFEESDDEVLRLEDAFDAYWNQDDIESNPAEDFSDREPSDHRRGGLEPVESFSPGGNVL